MVLIINILYPLAHIIVDKNIKLKYKTDKNKNDKNINLIKIYKKIILNHYKSIK